MAQKTPYFLTLDREKQCKALEAVVFASDDPLTTKDLFRFLILEDFNSVQPIEVNGEKGEEPDNLWGTFTPEYFDELIAEVNKDLDFSSRPFRIVNIGGGFQFATTPQYGEYVQRLLKSKSRKRLSQAALETVAIIAYKQPTTRAEIDSIRGVNSGEVVNALLEKNLIVISGRAETIGKPLLYSTSDEFLRVFGINRISDLPKLREIEELMEQSPQGALIAAMEEMNKETEGQNQVNSENEDSAEMNDTSVIVETEQAEDEMEGEISSEMEAPSSEIIEMDTEAEQADETEEEISSEMETPSSEIIEKDIEIEGEQNRNDGAEIMEIEIVENEEIIKDEEIVEESESTDEMELTNGTVQTEE